MSKHDSLEELEESLAAIDVEYHLWQIECGRQLKACATSWQERRYANEFIQLHKRSIEFRKQLVYEIKKLTEKLRPL